MGINAPFGLATKYNNTWVARYHAIDTDLLTMNINPSLGYKINDQLSLGLGLSAQYLDAELSNAIDFGTLDALPVIQGGFGGAFGLTPQGADGFLTLKGDSCGVWFQHRIAL